MHQCQLQLQKHHSFDTGEFWWIQGLFVSELLFFLILKHCGIKLWISEDWESKKINSDTPQIFSKNWSPKNTLWILREINSENMESYLQVISGNCQRKNGSCWSPRMQGDVWCQLSGTGPIFPLKLSGNRSWLLYTATVSLSNPDIWLGPLVLHWGLDRAFGDA